MVQKTSKNKETISAKLRFKMRAECNRWPSRESSMTSGPLVCRIDSKTLRDMRCCESEELCKKRKIRILRKQHFFVKLPAVISLRNKVRVSRKLFILLLRYASGTFFMLLGSESDSDSSMC